jgi:lipopolysaccharide transport system ATP-binding protein
MSGDIAIKVQNLSKCYPIFDVPRDRLKQMLLPKLRGLAGLPQERYYREFWALSDISFEVRKGEAVGVVGRNGSGKSTLLQLICGTLSPTQGSVGVEGRIAALLELGSGFNPEFTGRENVFLNASIVGLKSDQIEAILDKIFSFADIGAHIDQPVKTYSSGMFVRLAFAVQAHLEPDILIIDEALSVGDQFFQAKCYAAIRNMMDNGTTILFVSHSAPTVKSLCARAILLDKGKLVMDGFASQVLDRYFVLGVNDGNSAQVSRAPDPQSDAQSLGRALPAAVSQPAFERRISQRLGSGLARFIECAVLVGGIDTSVIYTGATVQIESVLEVYQDCLHEGEVGLVVATIEGVELFAINSFFLGANIPPLKKGVRYIVRFEFICPLSAGARYRIDLGYRMPIQGEYVDKVFSAAGFSVVNQGEKIVPLLFDVPGNISIEQA